MVEAKQNPTLILFATNGCFSASRLCITSLTKLGDRTTTSSYNFSENAIFKLVTGELRSFVYDHF
ncbi:hypothetical protein [Nostoc piscinale]|uniref:hypothetical protein n=1 Tax=Nostoc piscinale TaxID=224012 RepID=UPI00118744F6|nr:hypothetical protein [Nostoc piscinale]